MSSTDLMSDVGCVTGSLKMPPAANSSRSRTVASAPSADVNLLVQSSHCTATIAFYPHRAGLGRIGVSLVASRRLSGSAEGRPERLESTRSPGRILEHPPVADPLELLERGARPVCGRGRPDGRRGRGPRWGRGRGPAWGCL